MPVLYGVGVGSADPELMTIKAIRVINECEVIAVPSEIIEKSVAYNIVSQSVANITDKEIIGLKMPMTKDEKALSKIHMEGAQVICSKLSEGKSVAFLTLGDPTIYSTFTYIQEMVAKMGFSTRIVNGIASFLSASALINRELVKKDESLHIVPATYGIFDAMKLPGTKVFMKAGGKLCEIKQEAARLGKKMYFIENIGMENEVLVEEIENIPDMAGYYSIVIIYD